MRIATYSRCSTSDQHPEAQAAVLREYAQRRGLEVVEEYIDAGWSGAKDRRPALDELVAKARVRAFDAVCVVKLDRLARSVAHLVRLAGEWQALGVDLIVLDQGIDTSTPAGRFTFHTLAAVAELERDLIRERTCAGLRAARRRGTKLGRPERLTPLDRARVVRLRAAGRSIRSIAAELGVAKSTVERVSHNPAREDAATARSAEAGASA